MSQKVRTDGKHTGISVIIPSLHQGRFIDEAIRSLPNQRYPNVEILVVDGGSTDGTAAG
jgi:glycosyltransferase involved in cell wall biosynthesis